MRGIEQSSSTRSGRLVVTARVRSVAVGGLGQVSNPARSRTRTKAVRMVSFVVDDEHPFASSPVGRPGRPWIRDTTRPADPVGFEREVQNRLRPRALRAIGVHHGCSSVVGRPTPLTGTPV